MLLENSTKFVFLLLITICSLRITGSPLQNHEGVEADELLSYQELLEKGTPIIEADSVFQHVKRLIKSRDQSSAEIAKETMKSFMLQMDNKQKQYAQITMHGIKYLVNMGRDGTALRAYNETLAAQLWNFLVDLFYEILCFFRIGNCQKWSPEDDEFCVEDAIFMKMALEQQLREVITVLNAKHVLMQEVEFSVHNISPKVIEKLKRDGDKEAIYQQQLETGISELEGSIQKTDEKFIAEKKAKMEEEKRFVEGTPEEREQIIKRVQEARKISADKY